MKHREHVFVGPVGVKVSWLVATAKLFCLLALATLMAGCDMQATAPAPYPTIQPSQAIDASNAKRVALLAQRGGHPGGVWDVAFSP
ncbi:MAG TPA: hypothetical protein VFG99_00715, partial [Chloroflexia bacterium]|nr:hypothetical protein [Chloroflexia bacterium]